MKGFRVPPQSSRKEAQRKTDTELQNLQMSVRVSQMMIQQMMENMKSMSTDLGSALNQLMELQYTVGALKKHFNVDSSTLEAIANEQRLKDFNEGAAQADIKENLEVAEFAEADSTVTLTSVAKDDNGNDRGIFRSRIKLSESRVPDLITGLTGKKVGDKVTVKLNGVDHEIELLDIKNSKKEAETGVSH